MDLSVIIVTYNSERDIVACLESVYAQDVAFPFEVIVVDNRSSDGTVRVVRERFPKAVLVEAEENLGFARANNLGLGASRGTFCLLLNPDTIAEPGALAALVLRMRADAKTGIVGCGLVDGQGAPERSHRRFPSLAYSAYVLYPFHAIWPRERAFRRLLQTDACPHAPAHVDWVTGACMLLRREMLDQIGLLDEGYFIYFEDTDLCRRASQANWKVVFDPGPRVVHLKGRSSGTQAGDFAVSQSLRSFFRYVRVHHGPTALVVSRGLALVVWAAHGVAALAGKFRPGRPPRHGVVRRHLRLLRVILWAKG